MPILVARSDASFGEGAASCAAVAVRDRGVPGACAAIRLVTILAVTSLLPACASDTAPCGNAVPAVRVHFSFDGDPAPLTWDDPQPVRLFTNDGMLGLPAALSPADVGPSRAATLVLPYPTGTTAGPATVSFLSGASAVSALAAWQSDVVAFSADPAACVDVDVPVHFVDGAGAPDGGVVDAAR